MLLRLRQRLNLEFVVPSTPNFILGGCTDWGRSSGADFSYIFSGENFRENSAEKFLPKRCWEKMEFSAEKVLKNHFTQKFCGIFRVK
jgi:hypothetical protein